MFRRLLPTVPILFLLLSACGDELEETTDDSGPRSLSSVALAAGAPSSLAVNPVTNRIYATYRDIDVLSVLDRGSLETVATVSLPPGGLHTIEINPETNKLYVINSGAGSISVVDGATNVVVKTIELSSKPGNYDFAASTISADSNKVYVGWGESFEISRAQFGVAVIDGRTDRVTEKVQLDGVARLLARDPNGERIIAVLDTIVVHFGVCPALGLVPVIDENSNEVEDCVNIQHPIETMAVDAEMNRVYLVGSADVEFPPTSGTLAVLDLDTLGTIATTSLRGPPARISVDSTSGRYFILTGGWPNRAQMPAESGLLLAFEGQAEVWSQEFDSTPLALAVDGEEHRIYVAAADRHLYVVEDR